MFGITQVGIGRSLQLVTYKYIGIIAVRHDALQLCITNEVRLPTTARAIVIKEDNNPFGPLYQYPIYSISYSSRTC